MPPATRASRAPASRGRRRRCPAGGRSPPAARSLRVALRELALEDLPGRVARQLLQEDDLARDLVAGEVRLDVVLELVRGRLAAGVEHDERAQALAELLVLDADHRDLV